MTRRSVIIPVHRGREWLPGCLAALRAARPDEIIAVDDGSPDGSAEWVAEHAPDVRLIRHPEARGFAAACNAGLRAATGDVIALLNQDTEVEPGWFDALVAALDDPRVGLAGSRATYPDGRIQHAGGWVDDRGEAGHFHDERPAGEVDYVTGASIALRRETLERLGGLDERFVPAYFEDVEWCLRAREAGLKVWYAPDSRLVHHEQSQLRERSRTWLMDYERNRLRLVLARWGAERFAARFLPAERAWLEGMGADGHPRAGVTAELYLYFLARPDEMGEGEARATVAAGLAELAGVALALRDGERRRLRALVEGYERGRVMRALTAVQRWWRAFGR